jgi:CheY-like chemotaxis protein
MVELLGGIDRASELVERLMAFGRQAKRERRVVEVAPILREAVKLLDATIPKNIKIVTRVDDESLAVFADPTQLHQIVMNLCTNAFHAMLGTGGVMTLFAYEAVEDGSTPGVTAGTYCVMGVADTGCGIPEEIRGRIFDPFFTTKPPGQGTGMGLAVVHGIVQGNSGAVVLDSRIGEGSTFRVYLPRYAPPPRQDVAVQGLPESSSFRGRILLVDDEEEILESTRMSLESMGFTVRTAADGRAAEEAVASAPGDLDLVLTDVNMPVMGGSELLTRLKRVRPDLPIVMMTGYSELMTDAEARALGAERIVLKPCRPANLARIIAEILGSRV